MKTERLMKTVIVYFIVAVLFGSAAYAEVNVSIGVNIGPPPRVVLPAPPDVVVIPGTYVYLVPGIEVDIFFYGGHWYRVHEGHWFRGRGYNGPWVVVAPAKVPARLLKLPPGYRNFPPGHKRVPYGQLKKNWRKWEREKHWDKEAKKVEKERHKQIEKERHEEAKERKKEKKEHGKGKEKD